MQGGEGILGDGAFVGVAPHLQTHQGHPDVQGSVELKGQEHIDKRRKLEGIKRPEDL